MKPGIKSIQCEAYRSHLKKNTNLVLLHRVLAVVEAARRRRGAVRVVRAMGNMV